MIDHGELFWIDLNPFVNKYVLAKVIDHSYYRETQEHGSPYFIYVYDHFVSDMNDSFPVAKDRKLYCHPFNCKLYFINGLWGIIPISIEKVTETEIKDQVFINARAGVIPDIADLVFSATNLSTLDFEFNLSELINLELLDFYIDKDIQSRVILEYCKNNNINFEQFKNINDARTNYFYFFLERMLKILFFPSYNRIPIKEAGDLIFDWSRLKQSRYYKRAVNNVSSEKDEDPRYVFRIQANYYFHIIDPIFQECGLRGTCRNIASLFISLIFNDKIEFFLQEPNRMIIEKLENTLLVLRFYNKADRDIVNDFFNLNFLNPDNLRKLLPLLDHDIVKEFSGLKKPSIIQKREFVRFEEEETKSEYLIKYFFISEVISFYSLTINIDLLQLNYGDLIDSEIEFSNGEIWAELLSVFFTSKYKWILDKDFEVDDEASTCTFTFDDIQKRDKAYRFLAKSFKNEETVIILLSSL